MQYRREIDGLRALAVIPVIFFHAGLGFFAGGFVGVDVFFVISGYLITSIIVSDIERGQFSIARFYERRIRRILPALLVVTLVCLPFAWLWMLPGQLKAFSSSLIAVSLFASNILFWRQTDYFAAAAEEKPLLHTWSLAVEEQFYVVFPLLLLILWRMGRRGVAVVISVIALASLLLTQLGDYIALFSHDTPPGWEWLHRPGWAFFLAPTRAWELLAGALTALFATRLKWQLAVAQAGAAVGLILVAGAALLFDSATPTPSAYTLIPVVGTVMMILFARQETLIGSWLAQQWLVTIGLCSYSAYLWHQPLLAFARIRSLDEPGTVYLATLCLSALGLAYLTWRFIEVPFRDRQRVSTRTVYGTVLIASSIVVGVGFLGRLEGGAEHRFELPPDIAATIRQSEREAECFDKKLLHTRRDWLCELGSNPKIAPSFMVFGDSHAFSLLPAFDKAASQAGLSGRFVSVINCPPLLDVRLLEKPASSGDCNQVARRVLDHVADHGIRVLVLVARWTYYTDGGYTGSDLMHLGAGELDSPNRSTSRMAFDIGFAETLAAYGALGVRVILVGQVPQQLYEPSDLYYRLYSTDEMEFADALRAFSVPRNSHQRLQTYVRAKFQRAEREGRARFVSLDDIYCDGASCPVGNPRQSYFFDDDHLSVSGALKAVELLRALLAENGEFASPVN